MGERGDANCHQGDWAVFLRLAGCNLRCSYCDTIGAQEDNSGEKTHLDAVCKILTSNFFFKKHTPKAILVTGGEPLLQQESLIPFIKAMSPFNFLIETNGSISIEEVRKLQNVSLIVDHKSPSSGENGKMVVSLDDLRPRDTMKFVVKDEIDYWEAVEYIKKFPVQHYCVMSPVVGKGGLTAKQLYNWLKRDRLFSVGINIQLHKILKVE
jgi:7-carboxy-7-deazaguanine synthase